jgi:pimeloyl-ACP methyl ester carboxylesterase
MSLMRVAHEVPPGFVRATDVAVWGQDGGSPGFVFLHGFGEGAFVWDQVAEEIAAGRKVIAPDLKGHGDSAWDDRHCYTVEDHAADVRGLLQSMPPEPFVLVGHSMGGAIALRVAAERPEGLIGLVVVDFGAGGAPRASDHISADFRESTRPFATVAEYSARLCETRPLISPERARRYAEQALRPRREGGFELKRDPAMLGVRAASRPFDAWDALSAVQVPALILRGAFSGMLSLQVAQDMARAAPYGALATVAMAGHGVMLDNPSGFVAAVRTFVAGLTVRAL